MLLWQHLYRHSPEEINVRRNVKYLRVVITVVSALGCAVPAVPQEAKDQPDATQPVMATRFQGEVRLANIRQITFGGQNAEAYFSADASELIYQARVDDMECDGIFRMNADGTNKRMVSSGLGATTCAFIAPDRSAIIYASTHLGGDACPPSPDMSQGYVWALYDSYDIFKAGPDGSDPVRLTETPGYDAEAVYSPKGDRILFTSVRTGDLELFMMDPDGNNVEQVTNQPGYDGGAFFSLDGNWIVWRASRPEGDELADYQRLLKQGLIRPSKLEIYVMSLAERKPIRLTNSGAANFAPYFHPDGKRVIFSSNFRSESRRRFDLFMVDIETKEIEQITHNESFDAFPMFSHDGTKLVSKPTSSWPTG
jgi:Tol biopolymer transport system component